MATPNDANPSQSYELVGGWDDTNHQKVLIRAKNISTDSSVTPNIIVGDLGVDVEVTVTQGVNTGTPTETAVSVGVASTSVLAANANAKYRQFINDSPNIIYLSFAGAAALNTGTRLNANGGSIVFDQYVPTGAVKAISSVANSNLLVTEG